MIQVQDQFDFWIVGPIKLNAGKLATVADTGPAEKPILLQQKSRLHSFSTNIGFQYQCLNIMMKCWLSTNPNSITSIYIILQNQYVSMNSTENQSWKEQTSCCGWT